MYLKLMVRGLLRYKKRGRRFFVLLSLCSVCFVFLFTLSKDFKRQHRDMVIGQSIGHLQVVPADSNLLKQTISITEKESVPLLFLDNSFAKWLEQIPEIEVASPVITRYGFSYSLDSELEFWISIIAVEAHKKTQLFPEAYVVNGEEHLKWDPENPIVPLLRHRPQVEYGEIPGYDSEPSFLESELKHIDAEQYLEFFHRVIKDFSFGFSQSHYTKETLDLFHDELAVLLEDELLYKKIPDYFLEDYDWKIEDAIIEIEENNNSLRTIYLNKKLFAALYPDDIGDFYEPLYMGRQASLQVPPFETSEAISLPTVIPIEFTGYVQINPLFMAHSFIAIDAFRHYMNLDANAATSWVIRLNNIKDTQKVKTIVEDYLMEIGSDAKVLDYKKLGEVYLATGDAFGIIISIMISVFVIIVGIFTLNLVLMAIIQRKREIGTGFALGLSNAQTIFIICGEIAVIVIVSYIIGSVLGFGFVQLAKIYGIPGMVFFPTGKLYLTNQIMPYLQSFLILFPISILTALIPLMKLRNTMPIDLLKEV